MLQRRVLTGVVAVPLLVAMALDGGWLFRIGVFSAALLGTGEAIWMARQGGHRPVTAFAFLLSIGILADAVGAPGRIIGPAIGLAVLGSMAVLFVRTDLRGSLTDWALTLALPLYVAGLVQFFVPLRERGAGGGLLTWPAMVLMGSWACDIAAYFVGRAVGRTRLAPLISPGKSVEGAAAGLIAAMMAGVLFSLPTGIDPFRMAGFGLAVGIGSVVGDLAESLLKRQCGVKDSGAMMPGHGGILDRMDALMGSAASAFFYLQAVL